MVQLGTLLATCAKKMGFVGYENCKANPANHLLWLLPCRVTRRVVGKLRCISGPLETQQSDLIAYNIVERRIKGQWQS